MLSEAPELAQNMFQFQFDLLCYQLFVHEVYSDRPDSCTKAVPCRSGTSGEAFKARSCGLAALLHLNCIAHLPHPSCFNSNSQDRGGVGGVKVSWRSAESLVLEDNASFCIYVGPLRNSLASIELLPSPSPD